MGCERTFGWEGGDAASDGIDEDPIRQKWTGGERTLIQKVWSKVEGGWKFDAPSGDGENFQTAT